MLLVHAEPMYMDVTWGAGGSTSDLTMDMCVKFKKEFGVEPNMHLTWYVAKACSLLPVALARQPLPLA